MSTPIYFAAKKSPEELAAELLRRAEAWATSYIQNGLFEKIAKSWALYHGFHFDKSEPHKITFSGEQGELVQLAVNHYRNIGMHLSNITTAIRPALEARATNSDSKSLSQTVLANGLLDYYVREKKVEKFFKTAVDHAIVLSEGFIKVEWDVNGGEEYGYNEDTKTYVRQGDIKFTNLFCLDVFRDLTKEDNQAHDWVLVRSYQNRFDLAAKYPEKSENILAVKTKDQLERFRVADPMAEKTEDIPVYEFYHERTPSMPDGRYMLFVSEDAVLYDGPLPYRFVPIFRIAQSNVMGTPFGSSILFDLMPLQDTLNMLYSTIATNQSTFGVQNLLMPRQAGINIQQITSGLNVIEYNPAIGKPEALNLTQTPAEIFNMIDIIKRDMETISGINSVARGNPEANLRTGNALALVQAQAVQFASGLQQSYIQLVEDVGTAIIKLLQDFASTPRVAAIVGKSNQIYLREFSGGDLENISRVVVDIANPLSKTTAGRLEIANNLIQMGLIKNIEQYFTVLNTGKLDVMLEAEQQELIYVKDENERLMRGEQIPVLPTDAHATHIREHRAILFSAEVRRDSAIIENTLAHIQEHIKDLREIDPGLLLVIGQQALPPTPPAQLAPPAQSGDAGSATAELQQPIPTGPEGMGIKQPNLPKVDPGLLPDAQAQAINQASLERASAINKRGSGAVE